MVLTVDAMGIYNAPVMRNDSRQALDSGVVHVPETSLPWTRAPQRNVYLAGHRLGWPGTGSRLIFYNLDQLSNGDEVLLKDRQGNRYRYKVTEKLVVDPSERWVMGQELDRDMVTLQSCTGPNFSKRLVIRADRV
jgi:sortase A